MPTGKATAYDLTTGVIVDMDEAIYMLSPVDSPMISGIASDGLSVLSERPTNEKKVEWMDESILTPRSTLAANITTGTLTITVATGDRLKFSTGDIVMLSGHLEWVKVTGYNATTDVLDVTRAYAGTAQNHATSATVIGVGLALPEGSDPENARTQDRTGRYNITQIFGPTAIHMSRTEAKVGKYGVADEWNHQLYNRISENVIAREQAYLYGQRADDTSNKVRTLGGLYYYLNSQGTVDSTTTTLTVGALQTNQQTAYDLGGVPDRIMGNPKRLASLTDVSTLTTILEGRDAPGRGRMAVQYIDTEFGRLSVVRNRWALTTDLFLFARENVVRRVFDTLQFEWLAKTGDARKGQIVCEESLEVKGAQQATLYTALTA